MKKLTKIIKEKKGLSEIVSYVLLIMVAISISLLVFAWLRGYVFQEELKCPDGVSVFIENYSCSKGYMTAEITNNGFFGIDALNIRMTDKENGVPSFALEGIGPDGKQSVDGTYYFFAAMQQGSTRKLIFNYGQLGKSIKRMKITPVRFEKSSENKKDQFVLCNDNSIIVDIEKCDV